MFVKQFELLFVLYNSFLATSFWPCIYIVLLTFCTMGNWSVYTAAGIFICFLCTYCLVFQYLACLVMLSHFLELQRNYKFCVCYYVLILLYICLIVLLLFSFMFLVWCLYLGAANYSIVALVNNILYTYNGIIFPSLPMSVLYGTVIMTLFDDVVRFSFLVEWLELNLTELIFTMSVSCSWSDFSPHYGLCCTWNICTLLWNGSSCSIFHIFSHMLGIVSVCGSYCSICTVSLQAF